METLNPANLQSLSAVPSAVSYNPKDETVNLPPGVVSVAGITVVTGGVELSCGSCMLAFGFWGALISFSCIAVGAWDQMNHYKDGVSHLLGLGLVILALSFVTVGSVVVFYLLKKQRRQISCPRKEGKEVLIDESEEVMKKVTV